MPELPEVETVRRGLEPWLTGAKIEKVTLQPRQLALSVSRRLGGGAGGADHNRASAAAPNTC